MRVAVVYFPARGSGPLLAIARAMAGALEAEGHRAEVIGPETDPSRLAIFDFLILGTESPGFGAQIPARLGEFLKQSYGLSGKRSFAFLRSSGLRPGRALNRLMAAMEGEGMRVVYSEIVKGPGEAAKAAISAPIERA